MSILDKDSNINPADAAADKLRKITKNTFDQMVIAFNQGSNIFWSNNMGATPEEIAASLGSDAGEIFYLHARLGELIGLVKPEKIQNGLSIVGDFVINEDNSVSIIKPEPPEVIVIETGVYPIPSGEVDPAPSGNVVILPSGEVEPAPSGDFVINPDPFIPSSGDIEGNVSI